jgi:hypothetical protein
VLRPLRYALIAVAALAFLVVSAGLARVLGAANAERDAAIDIVKAESHGDQARVIESIQGCGADAACRRRMIANVARLHSREKVRILRLDAPSQLALRARTGTARIAWRAGAALPVVQCVRLRRGGDVVHGFRVQVLALSDPIPREGSCPGA